MEMGQRTIFDIKFYKKKEDFLRKWQQNHFFIKKILGQPTKNNFKLKNAKIA